MNYYIVSFESVRHGEEGAPWFGKKIIKGNSVVEAQDKYFDWLRKQPEYIGGIKRLFFAVDETTQDVID